jgi:CheY-like chemotaxis protein
MQREPQEPAGADPRLAEACRRLAALSAAAPDGLETALRVLMDASDAAAAACCLLDARDQTLRLVSELGLSDAGCRALRRLDAAEAEGWTEPLVALLEDRRRVFTRDAGHELPPLLEPPEAMSAVACLPLHAGGRPRATLLLVTTAPATLDDDALDALAPALAHVGRLVAAIGAPPVAAEPEGGGVLDGARAVARSALDVLRGLRAEPTGDGAPSADDRVALAAERDELRAGQESLARAHEAEVTHLTARLTEAERQWAREHSLRIEQEHRFHRWREQTDAEREAMIARAVELIEAAEAERATMAAETEGLRAALAGAERASLAARNDVRRARAEADAATAAASGTRAEREELARALDDARAAAAEASLRGAQLEAEVAALAGREATARGREAEEMARLQASLLEGERALAAERARAERLEEARAGADEAARRADDARAAAAVELAAVRAALAETQRLLLEAEDRAGTAQATEAEHAAELARRIADARAAAGAELAGAREALAEARAALAAARSESERAGTERDQALAARAAALTDVARLARALEEARAAAPRAADAEAALARAAGARDARLAALEQRVGALAEELAQSRAREERSRDAIAAVTEDRDGVVARATGLMHAAEEARAAAAAEAETVRAALANTQAVIFEAEEESRRARFDLTRLESEVRTAQADREELERTLAEARARIAELERAPASRVTPLAARAPAAARRRTVAVVDDGAGFAGAAPAGVQVDVIAPGADAGERLLALAPDHVLVNLAVPGALAAVAALDAATSPLRVSACLATAKDDEALALGRVDVAGPELDPEVVLARLKPHVARGGRVLCVGARADCLLSLRQALGRAGLSASIAWDVKQAGELLRMVRPDAVVVDLGLPSQAGYAIVAELAGVDPPPAAILVPAETGDAADAFAGAIDRVRRACAMPRERLLDRLLRAERGLRVVAGGR